MTNKKINKATERLIDSVWTLSYVILSYNLIEIIGYNREDPEGYKKEHDLPQCHVVEDPQRNIVKVFIRNTFDAFSWVNAENCDITYSVSNPKFVFDYSE